MKRGFKITSYIIITLFIALFCLISISDKMTNSKSKKIFFSIGDQNEKFPSLILDKAKERAKNNNVEMVIKDAKGSAQKQKKDIEEAENSGYDAIICIPASDGFAINSVDNIKIPIVFVNNNPGDEILKKDKVVYVGTQESEAGKMQAEYLYQYITKNNKNNKEIKVVILKGKHEQDATISRTNAVKSYFADLNVNVKYVFEDNADWLNQQAFEKFNVFLNSGQDFNCVICNNDAMAIGVINSYKLHGIDFDTHPIVGIDATKEGIEAIKKEEMKFTLYQSAEGEAEYAIDAAITLSKGYSIKNIPYADSEGKNIWIPFEKVDINNVQDFE